jgi:hypothetical protein
LYYLQSRYYSPEWKRFLNADAYFDTGAGVLGTNMYCYANNDPINYADPSGKVPSSIKRFFEWALGWELFPQEERFVDENPSAAISILYLAYKAQMATSVLYSRIDGSVGNAFQHAYWSALMAYYLGVDTAIRFSAAHEGLDPSAYGKISVTKTGGRVTAVKGPYDKNTNMDLYNNAVGIVIGGLTRSLYGSSLTDANSSSILMSTINQAIKIGGLYWYK